MTKLEKKQKPKRGRPLNEARHDEIMLTASKLFMQNGLRATTMESIARELGISKLTLYSRFKNKDALFSAVIEGKCKEYVPDKFFGDFQKLSIEESLYRIAYGLMQLLLSEDVRNMERMLMAEANHKKNLIQVFYKAGPMRVKNLIAMHLQKLNDENKLNIPDPVLSTNIFAALIKGSDIVFRNSMNIPPKPSVAEIESYCRSSVNAFINAHS